METEKLIGKFKCKCTCNHNFKYKNNCSEKQQNCKHQNENLICNMEQRTFISFATDIVSVIAFLFIGSVIFWLAITRTVIDFLKKVHHSDRCTKIVFAGLLTILLLSITTHTFLNKRAWKVQHSQEKVKLTKHNSSVEKIDKIPVTSSKLPLEPVYLKVTVDHKHLKKLNSGNITYKNIPKKFTVLIVDEKKKEVFKTSNDFFVPEMALEMKGPPSLIVSLKDVILENY